MAAFKDAVNPSNNGHIYVPMDQREKLIQELSRTTVLRSTEEVVSQMYNQGHTLPVRMTNRTTSSTLSRGGLTTLGHVRCSGCSTSESIRRIERRREPSARQPFYIIVQLAQKPKEPGRLIYIS